MIKIKILLFRHNFCFVYYKNNKYLVSCCMCYNMIVYILDRIEYSFFILYFISIIFDLLDKTFKINLNKETEAT